MNDSRGHTTLGAIEEIAFIRLLQGLEGQEIAAEFRDGTRWPDGSQRRVIINTGERTAPGAEKAAQAILNCLKIRWLVRQRFEALLRAAGIMGSPIKARSHHRYAPGSIEQHLAIAVHRYERLPQAVHRRFATEARRILELLGTTNRALAPSQLTPELLWRIYLARMILLGTNASSRLRVTIVWRALLRRMPGLPSGSRRLLSASLSALIFEIEHLNKQNLWMN